MLESIFLEVDGSPMETLVGVPEDAGPFPGLLLSHHRYGLSPFTYATAERLVREGFAVVVPNHYHHTPDAPDDTVAKEGMTDDHCINDMLQAVIHLRNMPKVDPSATAILGHCMGGRGTLLGAANVPGFRCGVVFYGGGVMTPRHGAAPVWAQLGSIGCPIAGFFGGEDKNPSPEDVRRISDAFSSLGVEHEFKTYPGVGHGFMDKAYKNYNEEATNDAWALSLAFLRKHLA
jgi:carboxymethylenebutenolidase